MNTTIKKIIVASITLVVLTTSCSKDNDCTEQTWYQDADGDDFGNANNSQQSCTQPTGFVTDNTDFDDSNSTAYPGAIEICNDGIDNNGDGDIDILDSECLSENAIEGLTGSWTSDLGDLYTITNSIINIKNTSNNHVYHILTISDENDFIIICKNDASNRFYANLYSKFVFTNISENEFYLCQSFFDSPSQATIENSPKRSDSNDLNTGCGGFSWAKMTRN